MGEEHGDKVFYADVPGIFNFTALKRSDVCGGVIDDFFGLDCIEELLDGWLRSGAKDNSASVVGCQRFNTFDAGLEVFRFQLLDFIEDNGTVYEVMELSRF